MRSPRKPPPRLRHLGHLNRRRKRLQNASSNRRAPLPRPRQNSRRHQSEGRPSRLAVPHKIWETSRYSNLQKSSKSNQDSQKLWKRRLNRAAPADLHRDLLPNLATRKDRAGKALVAQSKLHLPIDPSPVARAGALPPQRQLPGCVAGAVAPEP